MPETKGITIEFYGKDIALQDTLTDINKGLKATRTELGDFKKQLKIDPSNLEAETGAETSYGTGRTVPERTVQDG